MIKVNEDLQFKLINNDTKTQLLICMEEPAELIQAISKVQRYLNEGVINPKYKSSLAANLCEEIADVYICLKKLQLYFDISDDCIQEWIDYKEKR